MTWLLAIALAVGAFALGAFVFGVGRHGWTTFAAALALGLAGYALQASPDVPAAPAAGLAGEREVDWAYVEARQEMVASGQRSTSNQMIVADGFARRGDFVSAAALLRDTVQKDPNDAEAWLALGNALVEHADGTLTQPALYAYRRASGLDPTAVGPGYFLGFALIRQGRIMEARSVWAATLESAREGAAGREILAERLQRLDEMIAAQSVPAP